MLRLIKSKVLILLVLTIGLLVVIGLSTRPNSKVNYAGDVFTSVLSPFQRLINYSGEKINGFFDHFGDAKALKEENELLKVRIDDLEKERKELLEYRDKNKELREALNIKDQFSSFDWLGSNIIAKDMGNWFNIFTIDRGSHDGISNNFAVITSKGLVGRVIGTDILSSKVITIIDEDSAVSARISKTSDLVIVKGDMKLKDQGFCIMDYIPPDVDISVDDNVETSGLGGIYPKGIVIGKVKEVRRKTSELNRYAIIEPTVDFKRLEEVYVLKPKNIDNKAGEDNK